MKGGYGQVQPTVVGQSRGQLQGDGQLMDFMQKIGQMPSAQALGRQLAQGFGQAPPPMPAVTPQQTPPTMTPNRPMWRNGVDPNKAY